MLKGRRKTKLIILFLFLFLLANSLQASADFTSYSKETFGGKAIVQLFWENTDPEMTPSPINGSTEEPLQLAVSVIVTDADLNHTMNVTFATNQSGSWVNKQTNTSITNGTTVYWTYEEANTGDTIYWWQVYVHDGFSNVSEQFYYTTESNETIWTSINNLSFGGKAIVQSDLPSVSGESPVNESTLVDLQPILYITVDEPQDQTFNITWSTNATEGWVKTNTTCTDGTYSQEADFVTSTNTTYWWTVSVNDTNNHWTNKTYHFKTGAYSNSNPTISDVTPSNGSTDIKLQRTISVIPLDSDANQTLNVTFATNQSGSWLNNQTNSSISSGTTIYWYYDQANTENTTYWWRVHLHDGIVNITYTYYYTTRENGTFNPGTRLTFGGKATVHGEEPVLSNPVPANGTTDVEMYCLLEITVNDIQGDTFNITWSTNATEGWVKTNTTCTDGTYRQRAEFTNSTNYTYWWTVKVNDSQGHWINATYHFTTGSYEWEGWSDWWEMYYLPSTFAPPSDFNAKNCNISQINLSWTIAQNTTQTYIRASKDTYPTTRTEGFLVDNSSNISYNHTQLDPGTTYYYSAWSYNSSFGAYTSTYNTSYNCTNPGSPIDLQVASTTMTSLELQWTKGTNATYTIVIRNETNNPHFPISPDNGTEIYNGTDTTYTDTGLASNETFYYAIWSYNPCGGLSPYNDTVYDTTLSAAGTPTDLTVSTNNDTRINLSWTKGETYTVIIRKSGSYPSNLSDGTQIYNSTGTSYIDRGLDRVTHYYYRAWGYNGEEYSDGYDSGHNITLPQPPVNLIGQISGTDLSITWDKGDGATRTVIYNSSAGYPTSPIGADGSTLVYNDTGEITTQTGVTNIDYYTGWSYALKDGVNLYSKSVTLLWGGLEINAYRQSQPNVELTEYTVFITNQDGSETYINTSCNNPTRIDVRDVPNGEDTLIQVSKTGYNPTVIYMDLFENAFYSVNFYLTSSTSEGGGEGGAGEEGDEGDGTTEPDCTLRSYIDSATVSSYTVDLTLNLTKTLDDMISVEIYNESLFDTYGGWYFLSSDKYSFTSSQLIINQSALDENSTMVRTTYYYTYCPGDVESALYYIRVVETITTEYSSYDKGVENAYVQVKKYINTTDSYQTISALYTDANGYINLYLLYSEAYKVFISKENYTSTISDYIPQEPNQYGQTTERVFRIEAIEIEPGEMHVENVYTNITCSFEPKGVRFTEPFTVYFNITSSDCKLEWYKMEVYYYNDTSNHWELLYSLNESDTCGGSINYTIPDVYGKYSFECYYKKQGYNIKEVGEVGSIITFYVKLKQGLQSFDDYAWFIITIILMIVAMGFFMRYFATGIATGYIGLGIFAIMLLLKDIEIYVGPKDPVSGWLIWAITFLLYTAGIFLWSRI